MNAPWDEARLKREHPFFAITSGQALFYLLQDEGVADQKRDALLEAYEAAKARVLALVNDVMARDSRQWALAFAVEPGEACPDCLARRDLVVSLPADDALLLSLLPPHGLGCRLTARLVPASAGDLDPAILASIRPQPLCLSIFSR